MVTKLLTCHERRILKPVLDGNKIENRFQHTWSSQSASGGTTEYQIQVCSRLGSILQTCWIVQSHEQGWVNLGVPVFHSKTKTFSFHYEILLLEPRCHFLLTWPLIIYRRRCSHVHRYIVFIFLVWGWFQVSTGWDQWESPDIHTPTVRYNLCIRFNICPGFPIHMASI